MTIDIDFYYKEANWKLAFEGNNSDVILAQSGAVYKDYIDPFRLVNDENGVDGYAGVVHKGEITMFLNPGSDDAVSIEIQDEANSATISGGDFSLNEWIFSAVSYNAVSREINLYVGDELVSTAIFPANFIPFEAVRNTVIGRHPVIDIDNYNLTGMVDDFRIYNSELLAQNIEDIRKWGERELQHERKTYIVPKGKVRGRHARIKINSSDNFNLRQLAIEFHPGRIR